MIGLVYCSIIHKNDSLHYSGNLQFEAALALTKIASGTLDQALTVVEAGAIPRLVDLLLSESTNIAEQSVWALGKIAGFGPKTRDEVLKHITAKDLLKITQDNQPVCITFLFVLFTVLPFNRQNDDCCSFFRFRFCVILFG